MLGKDSGHVHAFAIGASGAAIPLRPDTALAFQAMADAAAEEGIQLVAASGFRSFDRQLAIWNAKATGDRPCLNDLGDTLDLSCLDEWKAVQAILRFSALPGTSRHHWGTDLDVFDAAAVPADYALQLVPREYGPDGPFYRLDQWLQSNSARFGFARPYSQDRGGVAPEAWHLSYAPVAELYARQISPTGWRQAIAGEALQFKETVLLNLSDIFERFVQIP